MRGGGGLGGGGAGGRGAPARRSKYRVLITGNYILLLHLKGTSTTFEVEHMSYN